MKAKRPLRHIIKAFADSFNLTFRVNSSVIVGDNTVLVVENTLHLRKWLKVTINTVEYEILSVSNDTTFTIVGKPTNITYVTYPRPYLFIGTPETVGQELTTRLKGSDKYPMIYLYEVITEKFTTDPSNATERTSDIRLFFLDEANPKWDEGFNLETYYSSVVDASYRLADYFMYMANEKSIYFNRCDGYELRPAHKYEFFDEINSKLNEKLAGTYLRVNLNVNKENNC